MGEWDGAQTFDKGEAPAKGPQLRIVGSGACIEAGGGGDGPPTADPYNLGNWLPSLCYTADILDPCVRIAKCPDMSKIAEIMAHVYTSPNLGMPLAETLVGPGAVATFHQSLNDESVSSSIVCVRGEEAWQWCDGTRNREQLLSQAFGFLTGPTSYGRYSTNRLYQHYSTTILNRFTAAGAANCRRFVLIGHSYGGAAAAVAAARLRINVPDRSVTLCTMGAPRAGGDNLIGILRGTCQTHFRHPEDPIPYLPPQYSKWGFAFFNHVAALSWSIWGRYASYERRRTVDEDGFRDEAEGDGPTAELMDTILTQIADNDPLGSYPHHIITGYANNLAIACNLPPPF